MPKLSRCLPGSVKFDVYQLYFRYFASTWVMGVLVAVITLTEITSIYTNWFLRLWAGSFDDVAGQRTGGFYRTDDWTSPGDRQRYLTSYVTLALLSVLLYTARLCEYALSKRYYRRFAAN